MMLKAAIISAIVSSVYLEINKTVNMYRLVKLLEFCESHRKPLLLALDSNAHNTLWGSNDTVVNTCLGYFVSLVLAYRQRLASLYVSSLAARLICKSCLSHVMFRDGLFCHILLCCCGQLLPFPVVSFTLTAEEARPVSTAIHEYTFNKASSLLHGYILFLEK